MKVIHNYKLFKYWPRFFILKLIRFYQKTISFDHGVMRGVFSQGFCRFHPTCSEYGYQAIEKYGVIRGGVKAIWRVIRCNPWNPGGDDPLK